MELLHLKYFREAALREHITQAADALHISQPALSKVISQLERELGCKLFIRRGKNISLSPYGKVLLRYANEIFDSFKALDAELADMKSGEPGMIRLGTSFPFKESLRLEDVTISFLEDHPQVNLNVVQASLQQLYQLLINREIDIAFSSMPLPGDGVEWLHLFDEQMGVIISVNHPLSKQEKISLSDLSDEFFYCNEPSDIQDITVQLCRKAGFEPKIAANVSFPSLIKRAINQNQGVTILPHRSHQTVEGDEATLDTQVVFRLLEENFCVRSCGIAVLKNAYLSDTVLQYLDFLIQQTKPH